MFTKGMKVRCTRDYDAGRQFTAGKEYVVRRDCDYECYVEADDLGRENGWVGKYFEPVATFKVGDSVRLVRDDYCGAYKAGDMVTLTDVTDEFVWFTDREGDERMVDADLVVAEQPRLSIRDGRYYRTRDGRKVGPMRAAKDDETWKDVYGNKGAFVAEDMHSSGYGGIYAADGTWLTADDGYNRHNIIAEWQDEPASAAAPKFKVGDVVDYANGDKRLASWQGTTITAVRQSATGVIYDGEHPERGSGTFFETWLLPHMAPSSPAIVARLDNGQPLPARKPYVHASVTDASKEATRLAKANPGREFAVYEMVHSVTEEPQHEWQRLAIAGDRDGAAEVLHRLTGMRRSDGRYVASQYAAR